MVTQAYLLHRPAAPSTPKLFLDQRVIPALIDAAGAIEARIETTATLTRQNPVLACGAMLAIGWLLGRAGPGAAVFRGTWRRAMR